MSKNKSKTLYSTPFSKAYWVDAASEIKDTKILVFAALMIAVRVALKLVAIPITPVLKINTAYLANALGAMVFGPVMAAICAVASDILGYLQNPEGVYFIPFLFQEIAGSVVFALFLYRAKVTPVRTMLSRFTICVLVNMAMQIPIMMWYYSLYMGGKTYTLAMAVPGIIKNVCMFPIESVLLTLFLSVMVPITNRMGLTFTGADAKEALKFTKKQIITLAVLFVVAVCSMFYYLSWYYENTSLSASYTTQQRYEENTRLIPIVADQMDSEEEVTLVTTIDSAYKKFLGTDVTYNVVVYAVDLDALGEYDKDLETIRGMSKSKAKAVAGDGVMTQIGTAVVVLNEKTGEVVSVEVKLIEN